jgi:hypothetical protein
MDSWARSSPSRSCSLQTNRFWRRGRRSSTQSRSRAWDNASVASCQPASIRMLAATRPGRRSIGYRWIRSHTADNAAPARSSSSPNAHHVRAKRRTPGNSNCSNTRAANPSPPTARRTSSNKTSSATGRDACSTQRSNSPGTAAPTTTHTSRNRATARRSPHNRCQSRSSSSKTCDTPNSSRPRRGMTRRRSSWGLTPTRTRGASSWRIGSPRKRRVRERPGVSVRAIGAGCLRVIQQAPSCHAAAERAASMPAPGGGEFLKA